MKTITNIERLLDKYLDGETTCSEEAQLHRYFAETPDGDIPSDWRCYKALFAYQDSEKAEKVETATIVKHHPSARIIRLGWWSAAAASVALVVALAIGSNDRNSNVAYIDGKKTHNAELIQEHAEQALTAVSLSDDELFSAIAN